MGERFLLPIWRAGYGQKMNRLCSSWNAPTLFRNLKELQEVFKVQGAWHSPNTGSTSIYGQVFYITLIHDNSHPLRVDAPYTLSGDAPLDSRGSSHYTAYMITRRHLEIRQTCV